MNRAGATSVLMALGMLAFGLLQYARMEQAREQREITASIHRMLESEPMKNKTACMSRCSTMGLTGEVFDPCVETCSGLGAERFPMNLTACEGHCASHDCKAACFGAGGPDLGPCLHACTQAAPKRGFDELFGDACVSGCAAGGGVPADDACNTEISQEVRNYLIGELVLSRAKSDEPLRDGPPPEP